MKRRTPSFARALLLLLVAVGPLQAQTVFACAMMGRVMQGECCCEHHEAARDCGTTACDAAALESTETPCCEHSVGITADPDARHDGSVSKPVELRCDVEPPHFLVPSFEASFTPQPIPGNRRFHSAAPAVHGGSDTWLATQRLRI